MEADVLETAGRSGADVEVREEIAGRAATTARRIMVAVLYVALAVVLDILAVLQSF